MKKIRIILSIIICLILMFTVTACGSSKNSEPSSDSKTEAVNEANGDNSKEEQDEKENESKNGSKVDLSNYNEILVDDAGVKFEITGLDPEDFWGYSVKVYLENNTDKTLMYSVEDASINGVMSDPFWASEVQPGKKSNESFAFSSTSLNEAGISDVTEIEFQLNIHDSEDYSAEYLVQDIFKIYPLGEENAVVTERTTEGSDVVLFESDDCKMTVIGYDPDSIFGYAVKVYLENKTYKMLMFSIDDASINGFMADPFWATTVAAGKRSYNDITWSSSVLEENKIENIESIEMRIQVRNDEDWSGDYLVDDTFSVEP